MFRAELDALPIGELNHISYASTNPGVAHVCGHDGHMSIVAGLALKVAENRPETGRVVFVYQPAEEVEQGARGVVNDERFEFIQPDFVFALHNIPGVPKHQIVMRKGSFSAASKGMTVKLTGKTSHAAEPENGISPANAISQIIRQLHELIQHKDQFSSLTLLTIIHIKMGEVSFGTTPGYAEIMITLRAFENDDMKKLTEQSESIIQEIAREERLKCEITFSEDFPATENNPQCNTWIEQGAQQLKLDYTWREKPFKWSEDFAYFTQKYPGAMFGLGSGTLQPQLHNPDYDFPDEILKTGINLFYQIYLQFQNSAR